MNLHKFETVQTKFFVNYIVPIGVFGCATVILHNEGIKTIDMATVQLIKSTTPIFAALFAWLGFGRQKPVIVYLLFIITSVGVMVAVSDHLGEYFSLLGIFLVLGSAVTRAVAYVLSEHLMKSSDLKTGLELGDWGRMNYIESHNSSGLPIGGLIVVNCLLFIARRYVTNVALKNTSAITFSVFAHVKFIADAVFSLVLYPMQTHKFIGVSLAIFGTFIYARLENSNTDDDNQKLPSLI